MTGDPIRAALERLLSLETDNWGTADWDAAITDARTALAAAPEGEGPSCADAVAIYSEVMAAHECSTLGEMAEHFARAILARWGRPAAPPAPLEGEVGELVAWLRAYRNEEFGPLSDHPFACSLTRTAALLQQFSAAAPAVVPVLVSERLPEEGDYDARARCWFFDPCCDGWWCYRSSLFLDGDPEPFTHWLPAHAIPLPAPQGEEVDG